MALLIVIWWCLELVYSGVFFIVLLVDYFAGRMRLSTQQTNPASSASRNFLLVLECFNAFYEWVPFFLSLS